ncbi:hypothetical protein L5515_017160 [Caenorhabditis briggsae]|uniref:Uncharacterized protein n=1 Tax=Caenorhabditis briggsae TaxID=6238 RepID=A0AAE9JPR0_CAEBR|nr:hypothetical protein L5515_017160 [Caenorhabditis briggsae]
MSWKRTGFICEYDSKHVSVFDCKQRKLYKMLNTYELEKLEIGKCYDLKHMSIQETSVDEKFHNLVVFRVASGCVLADTIATIADEKDLKKNENFEKFRGKVWSQYLGFLRDPKNLFAENMKGGELGWVTVKYAPDEDTVFEINDVAENYLVQLPAEQLLPTPWSPNYPTVERPQHRLHPSQRVFDNKFAPLQPCFRLVKYGVCVQTDVLNPLYCRRKPGSTKHCHHLFAMTLGMYRCMHRVELGCWYQHEVRDSRRDQKKYSDKRNAKQFDSLTATKLFKIDPPLPTIVVNGKVEFEVEFPFDHDVLEKEGNRAIPDWFPRFEGLQKDAHFWNEYLGKVEIYPRQAREIIQIVEAWPLETIPDVFTVVATVALHYNAATNNETYPENGIFLVTNVKEVKGAN